MLCERYSLLLCLAIAFMQTRALSISKKTLQVREDNKFSPTPNLVSKNSFRKCDECPKEIRCVPSIQCPAHVRMKPNEKPQVCDLPHGGHGFCCTTGRNFTSNDEHLSKNQRSMFERSSTGGAHIKALNEIVSEARSEFKTLLDKEADTAIVAKDQPEFMHNLVFRSSSVLSQVRSLDQSRKAFEQVLASQLFQKREHISHEDFELSVVREDLEGTPLENTCDQLPFCPPVASRYRFPDGKCNNPDPRRGNWGSAGSPMQRLLPPSYNDGIWEPRTRSVDGSPLTGARTVSRKLIVDADRPHSRLNLFFMQFGQFLTHDVSQSSSITTTDGKNVRCCTKDGSSILPKEFLHFACFPIIIESDDEFYSQFHQGCVNFVRSALAPDGDCKLGYGKQLSKVTHFIDASAVYGTDIKTQFEVRSFQGGRLRMLNEFGHSLLPLSADKGECGSLDHGPCFFAGDGRANQIISLVAVHTLFAKEHNRIADILSALNPRWSDEVIFYETQRIVIAELQHITYNEWVPETVGAETMDRFSLHVRNDGYSDDYNPEVNPSITSEFSTAAQRFGHSTVDGKLLLHKGTDIDEIIDIPEVMFNSARLRRLQFYDELLLTLSRQPIQQVDSAVTHGLSRFLFRGANPFGLDLAAINIQRGRDHAVRPYNDYLEVSGHTRIANFEDFGHELGQKLAGVYHHPDDIDLWIGGLLESARGDGLIGPTFSDIIADQFSKLRQGDRYFYEHDPNTNPGAFTVDQLKEIKKTSLARLICDNSDNIQFASPKSFVQPDVSGNAPVPCSQLPAVNFLPWKTGE